MPLRRSLLASLILAALAGCAAPPPAPPKAVPTAPVAAPDNSFANNPIVYFLITDRFMNGNPANDHSYGRQGDGEQEIGTFHGGDLAGVTAKLKEGYFKQLGVNAIWITAPYEQIHGWVVGGNNAFQHYAYHGYYALDYTLLDQNMGTPEELHEMIDTAHTQGIRVLFDVVMNHPGYADIQSLSEYVPQLLWKGWEKYKISDYHSWIDYNNFAFKQWWGRDWVRAGLPGYIEGGSDDLTKQLAYLPDFRTESPEPVGLPPFYARKPDTRAVALPNTTVRGYLVKWLTDWVRDYGVDGFRCDTVKHVEGASWQALKQAGTQALAEWKAANPTKKIDDAPFWMTGEVWGHGVERDSYFDVGFDSLINFDFQGRNLDDPKALDTIYAYYADKLEAGRAGGKAFDALSYISSHDTDLYTRKDLVDGGSALLLAPGGVQIFYGDESARPPGPRPSGDAQQSTRSDMNWNSLDQTVLAHWRKLTTFRARHVAIARGEHRKLSDAPYAFARITGNDRIVAVPKAKGEVVIPVAGVFADGDVLRDAYSGASVKVADGKATVQAQGTVLLEGGAKLKLAITPP
ncbi:alpha-amylase family glycosyl hydrolase [Andreprevotia chitinilytica]|uniref:alpha-amylase family glycosyl hydrolase n=1 Tax=Andreprevotia chitinilytica TaxID=396808 RepID=UPI00068E9FE0|nr:alpha-amylase family glycosyl hydrolase [Andreprevotia chitinilytica]